MATSATKATQTPVHRPTMEEKSRQPEHVNNAQTLLAIEQLRKFAQRREEPKENEKSDLFAEEDEPDFAKQDLYLEFNFKKLYSSRQSFKSKSIALPKSIYFQEHFHTCLILRDNFITEENLNAIEEANIPTLTKVLPFKQIRQLYDTVEQREELLGQYDFFVVDDALMGSLPSAMGKTFYSSEKFPRILRVTSREDKKAFSVEELKESVAKTLSSASFLPSFSKQITLKVASLAPRFTNDEIVANVNTVLNFFGSAPLTSVGIKLHDSPVLPLYYTDRIYDDADVLENAPETPAEESKEDLLAKALLEVTDEQTVSTLLGARHVKRTTKDAGRVVKP